MPEKTSRTVEQNTERSFNEQYSDVHPVDSYGGSATYVDIWPEEQVSDVPVVLAGGWSIGLRALRGVSEELYAHGRRNIVIDHCRDGEVPEHDIYPRDVLHKANTLLRAMDDAQIEKVDVITQSAGALDAVVAASLQPERFRSLVLVAPAGMIGEDKVSSLAARFVPKMVRNYTRDLIENPKAEAAILLGGSAYIRKNIRKAWSEVNTIVNTRIDTVLTDLRAAGIKVAVLQSHDDKVFPPDRINRHVNLHETEGNIDTHASVAWKKAGHEDLIIHPERTAAGALQFIEQFERQEELHST